MTMDVTVSPHIAAEAPGITSARAAQSTLVTHPLILLINAHQVKAVQDKLANLNHFGSRCRMIHTIFIIAVIIAAMPNRAHMIGPPEGLSLRARYAGNRRKTHFCVDEEISSYHCK